MIANVRARTSERTVPSSADVAAARERFEAKFRNLVERQAGRPAGPGDSVTTHLAAQYWHDPEGAVARMKALAQESMTREASYARS